MLGDAGVQNGVEVGVLSMAIDAVEPPLNRLSLPMGLSRLGLEPRADGRLVLRFCEAGLSGFERTSLSFKGLSLRTGSSIEDGGGPEGGGSDRFAA